MSMHPQARIYVAGHRGLVGSALVRALQQRGHGRLIMRGHQALGPKGTPREAGRWPTARTNHALRVFVE
jgi:nucleoside-diphosphate-sugar epimerase